MVVELSADYYLDNFKQLIGFVRLHYANLLREEELEFSASFCELDANAQKLYVRLLCRTKSHFRLSKIDYPEIADIESAVQHLQAKNFLAINTNLTLDDIVPLFTRPELQERLDLSLTKSMKRGEIEKAIFAEKDPQRLITQLCEEECIVEVLQQIYFDLYRLCFFGNLYQDMTEFVLRDIGRTQFEDYPLGAAHLAFATRQQIDAHLHYYACIEDIDAILAQPAEAILDWHATLPKKIPTDANLERRIDRITNTLARQLERLGEVDAALNLFRHASKPPSRERQARILARMDLPRDALDLCQQIIQSPITDEEKQFAEYFAAKLAKKIDVKWNTKPPHKPVIDNLVLTGGVDKVEFHAQEHYAKEGQCFYIENTLFNGVFGLAIWDIIFAPIAGVFFNPFQFAPADFYEPEFRQQREVLLSRRMLELREPASLIDRATETYDRKQGIQNPLVQWQYLSRSLLELALDRIPIEHWLAVFERLLQDIRHNRNGMPDLILFPTEGGYCLIEVKGPGDRLQKNQQRWMSYFSEHGIPHKVAHVSWAELDSVEQ